MPFLSVGEKVPDVMSAKGTSCVSVTPMPGRGIPRPGMGVTLTQDVPLADITSGTFSPTLKKGIGLALIPTMVAEDAQVGVDIRGRREIFQLVKPPFVDPSVKES